MSSLPTTTTAHVPTAGRPEAGLARPAIAPPPGGGMSVKQLWAAALRHIWLIGIVFVVVGIGIAASYMLCLKYFSWYTARGAMIVNDPPTEPGARVVPPDQFTVRARQNAEINRITAESSLDLMLQQTEAQQLGWYKSNIGARKTHIELLREDLSVVPLRDSALIELRLRHENRDEAAEMVNYVMRYFQAKSREGVSDDISNQKRVLDEQLRKKETRLKQVTDALTEMINSKDFEARERERSQVNDRVMLLNSRLTEQELTVAEVERIFNSRLPLVNPTIPATPEALADANLASLRQAAMQQLANLAEQFRQANAGKFGDNVAAVYEDQQFRSQPAVAEISARISEIEMTVSLLRNLERGDPQLANLIARRQATIERKAELEARLGPNHPQVIDIQAAIDEQELGIRRKQAELFANDREKFVTEAQGALSSAKERLATISANLAQAQEEKRILEGKRSTYSNFVEEKARLEKDKQNLEDEIMKISMKESMRSPTVSVVAAAARPQELSFPRLEMFIIGGVFLALLLAFALVLLIELVDTSVRTTRDISEQVRLPLLGVVPQVQGTMTRQEIARLVVRDPMSALAESFRQIRTTLLFSAPVDQLNSIAITSAARDEGKTTVAANLAVTIALSGRRVLLVDANFRRPALDAVFGLAPAIGLSNVLTNQATLAEAAQPSDVPNLSIVVTGPTPPNPAELLGSATMRAFLDQADAEYDIVIFDTPPALLVADAKTLATMVDGVVTVVRASSTSRGMVVRLRDELARVRSRILGAVLNAARPTRGGYFRKSQQQYEEYHSQLNG